jgi:opacity protein-like surface antigen
VVNLIQPMEINNFVWQNVPAVNFSTSHPCLRIYVLPENLEPAFNETAIEGIDTQAELSQMEMTYGIQPGSDFKTAQMNFTALRTGQCPAGPCAIAALQKRNETLAAETADSQPTGAGFGMLDIASDVSPESRGQQVNVDRPVQGNYYIRIIAEGFGVVASRDPRKPYTYIERLGGVVWAVRSRDLVERQQINLELDVTNPLVMQRDFTANPPVEIKSPPRSVFLSVRVEAPQGIRPPLVIVRQEKHALEPGETTKAVLTVTPQGGAGTQQPKARFALLFHGGADFPTGVFNQFFDSGFSGNIGVEYIPHNSFSIVGLFGYHRFDRVASGDDLTIYQFSWNGRVYGGTGRFRPFFTGGAGIYKLDPGDSDFGFNVGNGIQFNVTPRVGIEAQYNFHLVATPGPNVKFSTLQGGLRFRF